MTLADKRIVYGAQCTWWDSIAKADRVPLGASGHGVPCCPHCQGVLFEIPSEECWFDAIKRHEANDNPGYRSVMEFGRGKCFQTYDELKQAFEKAYKVKNDEV